MTEARATVVVDGGPAEGEALILTAPISFWGGVDPKTGAIIDVRHPENGMNISGKALFVPETIGSSSGSTILLELVYSGNAPAALVLHEPDAILLLGLIAAGEMNLEIPPALVLPRDAYGSFDGRRIRISADGKLSSA